MANRQYVFGTEKEVKRYRFPTHINDLVIDRVDAKTSEVFIVIIKAGRSSPVHKHDDTEQIFYVVDGYGYLEVNEDNKQYPIHPGDVIRIPPSTLHKISCTGNRELRYVAVDCFIDGRPESEPTWDSHVKALCLNQGWNYREIVK